MWKLNGCQGSSSQKFWNPFAGSAHDEFGERWTRQRGWRYNVYGGGLACDSTCSASIAPVMCSLAALKFYARHLTGSISYICASAARSMLQLDHISSRGRSRPRVVCSCHTTRQGAAYLAQVTVTFFAKVPSRIQFSIISYSLQLSMSFSPLVYHVPSLSQR